MMVRPPRKLATKIKIDPGSPPALGDRHARGPLKMTPELLSRRSFLGGTCATVCSAVTSLRAAPADTPRSDNGQRAGIIDCHAHVLDPANFPYGADIEYKPSGQEIGPAAQLLAVMKAHGIRHTLLVQPNSGYGSDNSCMLDAIARYPEMFKGIAIAVTLNLNPR